MMAYENLFNYMAKEHGLNLLQEEMQEIERMVKLDEQKSRSQLAEGNCANRVLSDATRLKLAKRYFNQIKKYNNKLNEIGYFLSDSYSKICLFENNSEDSVDSL